METVFGHVLLVLALVSCAAADCYQEQKYGADLPFTWVKEGEDMRMRCRSCQCREGELTCTLDEGKTCDTYYDPSVDQMCLEWDADECCCLKTGCNVNGTIYDEGEDYVAGETHDGCQTYCTCGKFGTFGACYYVCATPAPVS